MGDEPSRERARWGVAPQRSPLRSRAWRDHEAQGVASGGYLRERDLPRLIPVFAGDLAVRDRDSHRRLIDLLRRALRQERARGLAADWSYDLGRHASLLRAYRAERDLLEQGRGRGDGD